MDEIWKPIYDFDDKYEISNLGRIRNIRTNRILKMTNKKGDYFTIVLYDENHKRSTRIHREVATAFLPNPNNLPCVNHIDGNKQNNCVSNLEWCTYKHNAKEAFRLGLNTMDCLNKHNKNKCYEKYGSIIQLDKNKKEINRFHGAKEASMKTGVCARNILQCINHEEGRKQAGGFIWIAEKEMINNEI